MDDPVSTNPTTSSPAMGTGAHTAGSPGGTDAGSPSAKEAASEAANRTAGAAKEETKAVATTAADSAKSVAGEAASQARSVVEEARTQATQVFGDASSELRQQVDQRLTTAAKSARSTAGQLRALAEGRPEEAGRSAELVQQASERLEHLAGRADELGVQGVAEELANFGRRRPLMFLAGAVAAGVVAGRMLKTIQASSSSSGDTNRSLPASSGPARLGAMQTSTTETRTVVAPASGSQIGGGSVIDDPTLTTPGSGTVGSPGGIG